MRRQGGGESSAYLSERQQQAAMHQMPFIPKSARSPQQAYAGGGSSAAQERMRYLQQQWYGAASRWAASPSAWNAWMYDPRMHGFLPRGMSEGDFPQFHGRSRPPSSYGSNQSDDKAYPQRVTPSVGLWARPAHSADDDGLDEQGGLFFAGGCGSASAQSSAALDVGAEETIETAKSKLYDLLSLAEGHGDDAAGPVALEKRLLNGEEAVEDIEQLKASLASQQARAAAAETEVERLRAAVGELLGFVSLQPQSLADAVREVVRVGWDSITWNRQYTAVHLAAEHGRADVIRLLLAVGADPQVADYKGRRAIDIAKNRRHAECVELLKQFQNKEEATVPPKKKEKKKPAEDRAASSVRPPAR